MERVAPGPLDVADHRQGATPRVRQQPPRQRGDEGVRGDLGAAPERLVGEVVELRGPGPVAGEVEGDQAVQLGIGSDVVGGQVEVLRESV